MKEENVPLFFSARGHGSALAHFEPLYNVINLTKMKGGGSLGHEWIHALDFYLGTQYGIHGLATEDRVTKYPKEFTDLIESLTIKTIVSDKPIEDEDYKKCKEKYETAKNFLNRGLIKVLQGLSQDALETCDVEKYVEILVEDAKKCESYPNPILFENEKSVGMLYTPIKIDEVKNIEDKSDDMIIDEFGEFKLFDEEQHLPTTPFMESNQYEMPDVDYKNVCKAGKHKQEKKIEMPTLF